MLALLCWLACGTPAPEGPALELPAPFSALGAAASGATIGKVTETTLVLHYPKGADPVATGERFVKALEAQGHTVVGPKRIGPSTTWIAQKDGAELLVAAVPKTSRLEIHLDR